MSDKVSDYLENFLNSDSLFKDKRVFQANFTPESIFHRDDQVQQIAQALAPCLKQQKPSNLFIYGKTGTGKTLSVRYVTNRISSLCKQKQLPVKILYVNCKLKKVADTEYRIIAHLSREIGKEIPSTGLPTEEVYNIFYSALKQKEQLLILVLDEIDTLVKKAGDEVLYNLTRINSELEHSQLSIIGISNDLRFTEYLDPRVKSSLSEEEQVFPPYNALQIQEILKDRAENGFVENSIGPGLIPKCSAIAAREHGDARRALDLLRVAGEIAERNESKTVNVEHLDMAEQKIECDRVVNVVVTQPKQSQLLLYSVLHMAETHRNDPLFTGQVYDLYQSLCSRCGLRPLTQRRISDILAELDMLGIIQSKVISKGRYGRTREICVNVDEGTRQQSKSLLKQSLGL